MAEQRVESVERALTLLNAFRADKPAWSLAELANETGFYKSTILRLMGSLERFGYTQRDRDGLYHPGPALLRLGQLGQASVSLEAVVRPVLEQLRDQTRETASFFIRDGDERVCLYRENGRHELRHHVEEGARLTLGKGAAGLALAHPAPERGEIFQSFGAREASLAAIAVPIIDSRGKLHGALAVSGLINRFDDDACTRFGEMLKEKAVQIERQIG
ncbi:IclR family transcriptional regulator [Halomonas sp. ML-15]|uniref:IclR family transcriptional regulator n=1 Tax=Halomonas sp. ML-15 TaxID=2773305 RepID=UPI0017461B28|nr:IclR family transcriptional regulator [Halomonas sp. ML-15]MBD3897635.1 IclR family transcriptional regulator [Halomonas sp. ML-15]